MFVILSMEKITIKDIKLIGFHGLYDNEKRDGVNLGFDIELFFENQIKFVSFRNYFLKFSTNYSA